MTSTFRSVLDDTYGEKRHNKVRWEKTMAFLAPAESTTRGLDIGDRTPFTAELESFFGCPFDSTNVDLDVDILAGRYDIVTCFEVLEHLFNPLHCLLQIKNVLVPDGRLYLSTPRRKPHFLWNPNHFHEMSSHSIGGLFGRAGFTILRQKEIINLPWWFYFTGFRPLMRGLFDRIWLFELKTGIRQPIKP